MKITAEILKDHGFKQTSKTVIDEGKENERVTITLKRKLLNLIELEAKEVDGEVTKLVIKLTSVVIGDLTLVTHHLESYPHFVLLMSSILKTFKKEKS
jgi:methyl coenzyme M reductase subunit C-like uncharacterized protein (methanogenesis marker protein 7)